MLAEIDGRCVPRMAVPRLIRSRSVGTEIVTRESLGGITVFAPEIVRG
jgi:hypothetical protein